MTSRRQVQSNKVRQPALPVVDILVLHGKSLPVADYLVRLLRSFGLTAAKVLDLPSGQLPQEQKVTHYLRTCKLPIVLATFDDDDVHSRRARLNVYDEIARLRALGRGDMIALLESRRTGAVDLPSNVRGQLVEIHFSRSKLHALVPPLVDELRSRGLLGSGRERLPRELTMNDTFARAGLEKVYTNFADAEPDMAMAFKIARRTSITIMQFYVPQVLEEAYRMRWRELLNGALHRGCQLSVLILDPNEDEIICRRSRQIGREPQDFRRKIEQSIQYFEGLRASPSFSSRIDITLFRAYLVGPLLIIGDAAYQGFFSPGKDGLELPWLRIRRSTSTTLKDLWLAPERIIQELGPVNRPHLPKTGSNAPTQPRRRSVSRPR